MKDTIKPMPYPKIGLFDKCTNNISKTPLLFNSLTPLVIFINPVNKIPKPINIVPVLSDLLFVTNIIKIIPIINASGASVEGLKNCSQAVDEESISIKRIICPVTVVPIFAPTTTPNDCLKVKRFAATSPDVITIVAVDDWISAVTITPNKKDLIKLSVTFERIAFKVPVELSLKAPDIIRIPYRNKANPPNKVIMFNIDII